MKNGGSFHSYVTVYQRLALGWGFVSPTFWRCSSQLDRGFSGRSPKNSQRMENALRIYTFVAGKEGIWNCLHSCRPMQGMVCVHSSVVTLDPRPLVVTSSSWIPKMNKSTGNQTWFAGNFTIYIYIYILIIVDVPSYKPCNTSVFGGGVFHNFRWLSHIFHSHIS